MKAQSTVDAALQELAKRDEPAEVDVAVAWSDRHPAEVAKLRERERIEKLLATVEAEILATEDDPKHPRVTLGGRRGKSVTEFADIFEVPAEDRLRPWIEEYREHFREGHISQATLDRFESVYASSDAADATDIATPANVTSPASTGIKPIPLVEVINPAPRASCHNA